LQFRTDGSLFGDAPSRKSPFGADRFSRQGQAMETLIHQISAAASYLNRLARQAEEQWILAT
jgi:hypothetical protein